MNITASPVGVGKHIRQLREDRRLTLAALAEHSGVSRASLSRIENDEVSPTAQTLGGLANALALPISQLLAPLERSFQPLIRREEQTEWRDPENDFHRRSISPANGRLTAELIEARLGAHQTITYNAPSVPGQEHHLFMLSGALTLTVEGTTHRLKTGDCLRYKLFGATQFETSKTGARYVLALV